MSAPTGGPAYPHVLTGNPKETFEPGVTVRDYFAAEALKGLMANASWHYSQISSAECVAALCFKYADAMLVVRSST